MVPTLQAECSKKEGEQVVGYLSDVQFVCPKCGQENMETVPVPGTDWTGDSADERFTQDNEDVPCQGCGDVFSICLQNNDGRIHVSSNDSEDIRFTASDAYEPDDDIDLPSDPAINILMMLEDIREVLNGSPLSFHTATLHRMAFIQQCAALEAYLSDTLVGEVLNKAGALKRIISGDRDLKEMKLPLSVILNNTGLVPHTVAMHLRGLLYHNFKKIEIIWRHALKFDLFPSADIRLRMMKAEPIRHDCVHRNGKDKRGDERTEVDAEFVEQMDKDIRLVIQHIEGQLPWVT